MSAFPIPSFSGLPDWPNVWSVSSPEHASADLTLEGKLHLVKTASHTMHVILNGEGKDLADPSAGAGVAPSRYRGYTISISAQTLGSLKVQFQILEFDENGNKLSRLLLSNGERALLVADTQTTRFVCSLRTAGKGELILNSLTFNPNPDVVNAEPGLHLQGINTSTLIETSAEGTGSSELLLSVRSALLQEVPIPKLLTKIEGRTVVSSLVAWNALLEAKEVARQLDIYEELSSTDLQHMCNHARRTGYLEHALKCVREIARRSEDEADLTMLRQIESESEFYKNPWGMLETLMTGDARDPSGPVIHLVKRSLPEKLRGYTVRTKYATESLRSAGIETVVVVQVGGNGQTSAESLSNLQGVPVIRMGGEEQTQTDHQHWLSDNVAGFYDIVRRIRPRAIHAHSDFMNGLVATHVGRALGIPVVFEIRGFWEESWLLRTTRAEGWENPQQVLQLFGAPEAYTGAKAAEIRVWRDAHHVITLAETMRDYAIQQSLGELGPEDVTIVPNAVNPSMFDPQKESNEVRSRFGFHDSEVVVGYISSISEHEGIEILLKAFNEFTNLVTNSSLLIVGSGSHLGKLKKYCSQYRIPRVHFAGSVSHEEVIAYYRAIDVFVVPRERSLLTELVTPLKPYEAFAAGRATVLSDLPALRELAKDVSNSVKFFPPGDSHELAKVLTQLSLDPDLRASSGTRLQTWVTENRTWKRNAGKYAAVYSALGRPPTRVGAENQLRSTDEG